MTLRELRKIWNEKWMYPSDTIVMVSAAVPETEKTDFDDDYQSILVFREPFCEVDGDCLDFEVKDICYSDKKECLFIDVITE